MVSVAVIRGEYVCGRRDKSRESVKKDGRRKQTQTPTATTLASSYRAYLKLWLRSRTSLELMCVRMAATCFGFLYS